MMVDGVLVTIGVYLEIQLWMLPSSFHGYPVVDYSGSVVVRFAFLMWFVEDMGDCIWAVLCCRCSSCAYSHANSLFDILLVVFTWNSVENGDLSIEFVIYITDTDII